MKHCESYRLPALIVALALCVPCAALADEAREIVIGDPAAFPEAVAAAPEDLSGDTDPTWNESEEITAECVDAPVSELPEAELAPAEPTEAAPASDFEAVFAPEALTEDEASGALCLRLGLGEVYTLGVTVKALKSEDASVVAADAKAGTITAVGKGSARVAATDRKGKTVVALFKVLDAPARLKLDADALALGKGETRQLTAVLPEGSASGRIAWASSDKGVATVSSAGVVTAKGTGTATVAAMTYNGVKAKVSVKVGKAPSGVTLSEHGLVLGLDETHALSAKLPGGSASALEWASSDEAVVAADANGGLRAVGPGTATVAVRTFNQKWDACQVTVLEGRSPTSLSLGVDGLTLGKGEKLRLVPSFGAGECAILKYASSKKSVAKVSSKGLVTAVGTGTATVAVKTHNGLKAKVKVRVVKAPKKVALSEAQVTVSAGQSVRLTAGLPSGSASALTWKSSDPDVATVDAQGVVTGVSPGTATVAVKTFNKRIARCQVTVVSGAAEPTSPEDEPSPGDNPTAAAMAARLRASSALGGKRDAIASVAALMVSAGFEPAFAAGVGANIYAEGTYGLFESSRYIKNYLKRPRYFCYLDGGDYYTNVGGEYKLTAVYLSPEEAAAYTGEAEARVRYGEENYYRDHFSGRYVQDIDLAELEALVDALARGGWEGKFGLGIVQWTGARTKTLTAMYRKHAGSEARLSKEQVAAAENEMIMYDFKGSYAHVYNAWKSANAGKLTGSEAARSAGALVCTKYEIPADKDSKAVTRGAKAQEIYRIMMGN